MAFISICSDFVKLTNHIIGLFNQKSLQYVIFSFWLKFLCLISHGFHGRR